MYWGVLLATFFIFTQPVLASMNKCQDDEGKFHYYANIMPSECQNKTTVEMNKRGVVIRTQTAEFKEAPEIDPAQQAADEQLRLEAERRDAVLLNTYTSEEDINWALDRNIHPIELAIAGIEKRLEIARNRLQILQRQAAEAEKTGTPALASIQQDMIPVTRDVSQLENELQRNHRRINGLKEKFASDRKRFQVLKAQKM